MLLRNGKHAAKGDQQPEDSVGGPPFAKKQYTQRHQHKRLSVVDRCGNTYRCA